METKEELKNSTNWAEVIGQLHPTLFSLINNFQAEYSDDFIQFTGETSEIEIFTEQLNICFNNPEWTLSNLKYIIAGKTHVSHAPFNEGHLDYPNVGGLEILFSIFGPTFVIEDEGVQLIWEKLFLGRENTAVLLSQKPILNDYEKTLWQDRINLIIDALSRLSVVKIRQALSSVEQPEIESETKIERILLEKCFGFSTISGQTFVYFDYKLFLDFIYPPRTEISYRENDQAVLSIPKKQIIAYMRQMLNDGILVENNEFLLLPYPYPSTSKNTIVLLLDISESMRSISYEYKEKLKLLVQKMRYYLQEHDRDTELCIVFFSDQESPALNRFSMEDEDEINKIISGFECNGYTRIYGTINFVLSSENIKNINLNQNNLTLVLFTDGVDNCSTAEEKNQLQLIGTKILTFGLGAEHDEELCKQLAENTGGAYKKLNSIADFDLLDAHFKQITAASTLMRILDGLKQLFVSVYDDPVRFPVENIGSFHINDKKYTFEKNNNIEPLPENSPSIRQSLLFFTPPTTSKELEVPNAQMNSPKL